MRSDTARDGLRGRRIADTAAKVSKPSDSVWRFDLPDEFQEMLGYLPYDLGIHCIPCMFVGQTLVFMWNECGGKTLEFHDLPH